MVDIGQDSGLYLEIAQKIFAGKKYYNDFFEYNFPLSFLLLIIPVGFSKLLDLSPIISADYFVNFRIFFLFINYHFMKYKYLEKISSTIILHIVRVIS
jgi:hypothetical protein